MGRAREDASTLSLKPGMDFGFREKTAGTGGMRIWLALSALLGVVFVATAVLQVWLYAQQVQNGYRLAKMFEEIELQGTVQRKLKLEWSRFRDPTRLEELGRSQFGLAPPRADQKVTVR